jgi:2-methylcitrate dehydratase PrpD
LDKDPRLNAAGIVEVRTRRGQSFTERVDHPTGTPQNPMSQLDMEEKFLSLSSKVINAKQAHRIIETVDHLENVENVRELADLVRVE